MINIRNAAQDFSELRVELVKEYEERIKAVAERNVIQTKSHERNRKKMEKLFTNAGLDFSAFEKGFSENDHDLLNYLKSIRPKLIDRTSGKNGSTEWANLQEELVLSSKYIAIAPLGIAVMPSIGPSMGEDNSRIVFPHETSLIRIKNAMTGSGSGFGAVAFSPAEIGIFFRFTPDITAWWNFAAMIAFDGFYILRADDGWASRKYAEVKLSATIKVFQYSSQGERSYEVFHFRVTNADEYELIERTDTFDTNALLKSGDPVTVKVTISLEARAQGSGSYAELNFQEGTANHIIPALLMANPG